MENYVGTIIKSIRQSKGVTQKELANNLCSIRQLSRIEMNLSSPTAYLISEISSRLGNDLLDYLPYSDDPNAYHVKHEIERAMVLFNKDKHNAALEMLENSPDLNQAISRYAKLEVAWLYGALSNYIEVPMKVDEAYYVNLLLDSYQLDNLDDIFKMPLRAIDYRILNSLIVIHLVAGDFDYAELMMIKAIENIETTQTNKKDTSYLRFIYNLSRLYFNSNKYQLALHYSRKGLDYCISNGVLFYLSDLSNIHGRALFKLDDKKNYVKYLDSFIILNRIIEPDFDYEKTIETLKEKYDLD